jgi:hypothetical protein
MAAALVSVWRAAPAMDVTAPEPSFVQDGDRLWVAYRTRRRDHFAVLRFSGVDAFAFEHDRLHTHPLFGRGLDFHTVHQVRDEAAQAGGLRYWVLTFGDDVLGVWARRAEVVVRAIRAPGPDHALASLRT